MSTTLRIAQVESGGGGNGLFVDTITSTTISDTRIRLYTYAVTAASELVIGDSAGPVINNQSLQLTQVTTYTLEMMVSGVMVMYLWRVQATLVKYTFTMANADELYHTCQCSNSSFGE